MDELAGLAQAIAAGWQMARCRPLHFAGCGCCGSQPILMNPTALAEDIDYALREKYRRDGRLDILDILDSQPFDPTEDFIHRLAGIEAGCEAGAVLTILRDILDMLSSMTRVNTSRFQISP